MSEQREPPVIAEHKARSSARVMLIAGVVLMALFFAGLVGFRFLQHNNRAASETHISGDSNRAGTKVMEAPPRSSAFAELPETALPGRYKWTDGADEFFIVLYDDHTFMNRDGTIFPQYRWEIEPDGVLVQWQRATSRLTNIERPGVYTAKTPRGIIRLEKLPPYEASLLTSPAPTASLILATQSETNGLIPINSENDHAAQSGGIDCFQILRKSTERQTCLHLKISTELKTPPFTNALLIIEFFDTEFAGGGTDRLGVQYDGEIGPYTNAQPLPLSGEGKWQQATFYLARPFFQNRQEGGADLRISVLRREFFVKSVKLVKNTILPETKMPVSKPR